ALLRNALVVFDLRTGAHLWKQALSDHYDEHAAWPLYAEPHLFIAAPFRQGAQVFQLTRRGDQLTARRAWASPELSNDVCSSVLWDGHVYGFSVKSLQALPHKPSPGQFQCLDLAAGAVRWATDQVGHASVLAADGKLILLNDTGTLILARAGPERYQERARVQ